MLGSRWTLIRLWGLPSLLPPIAIFLQMHRTWRADSAGFRVRLRMASKPRMWAGFVRLLMHFGFIRTRLLHGHHRALLLLLWLGLSWFIRPWCALIDRLFFSQESLLRVCWTPPLVRLRCMCVLRPHASVFLCYWSFAHWTNNGLETYNKTNTASVFAFV